MEKLQLVVLQDNKPILANEANDILSLCEDECAKANEQYNLVKSILLEQMLDNDLKKAETADFKISVRESKSSWIFNEEEFKTKESKDLVDAFIKKEVVKKEMLDVEKLKKDYPEVYASCLIKTEEVTTSIDEHKLWSTLRNVWEKYATEVIPEKRGTISIKRKEE